MEKNILGTELQNCCEDPITGFYRDGFCRVGPEDFGHHSICARVTEEFLSYSADQGNDLITPRPEFGFPGLKPGDSWCLCASRWLEAYLAGKAPYLVAHATSEKCLEIVDIEVLKGKALDLN